MATNESPPSGCRRAPELLAPAGNWECAVAAVENGADAIYFGLEVGFNARARAANFSIEQLPGLMRLLHGRGVKGYVTLNTLVFTDELDRLEENVRLIAAAGVDAVLVQDLGAVCLIRRICPSLPIHASTQMTMTSAATIRAIESLGIERVVLARELSIKEIKKISSLTTMPLECFVHGALCVAYSGQCLTSESFGGRSANRGQCAQACRLNYQLFVDGQPRDLGDVQYLLSPQDLAAIELIPELIDAGICSLKIEGRLKTPEYVANVVKHYRQAIDSAMLGQAVVLSAQNKREMELSFSRGFSPGWLQGCDHKRLVPGTSSAKRGVKVGQVIQLRGELLVADLTLSLAKGDGIVLQGDRVQGKEIGGRIYSIHQNGQPQEVPTSGRVELMFERGLLRDAQVYPGQTIWQTDDPQLTKRLRGTIQSNDPIRRMPIDVHVTVGVGQPLKINVTCSSGVNVSLEDVYVPEYATKHAINASVLEKQLGRLGGSNYILQRLTCDIDGQPMLPLSVLGAVRRKLIETLDLACAKVPERKITESGIAKRLLAEECNERELAAAKPDTFRAKPTLRVLCRSLQQLESILAAGIKDVYADFHDIREYRQAVQDVHAAGGRIYLATLRIHKPGEDGLFTALARQAADGWLVRNLAALDFANKHSIPAVGDFSLNVTNPMTAQWLMEQGLIRMTASYDLNRDQLTELVSHMRPTWLEVVVHQHMPMFHMEHCVFCAVISPGTNKTNCGRPCDRHDVKLKDRVGVEHVLHADIGCRNTLFNGTAQSGSEAIKPLLEMGVCDFRIELLRDAPQAEIERLVSLYRDLLDGKISGAQVWSALRADNRVGVTRGTLEQPRNPLAIL